MKVVIVSEIIPPEYSGAGLYAYNYSMRLYHAKDLAFLLTRTIPTGNKIYSYSDFYVDLKKIKIISISKLKTLHRIKKGIFIKLLPFLIDQFHLFINTLFTLIKERNNYNIIHCFSPNWLSFYSIIISKLLGKKIIVEITLLNQDDPLTVTKYDIFRIKYLARRIQFFFADSIVNISKPLYKQCIKAKIDPQKLTIVNRSVDTERFTPLLKNERDSLKEQLNIKINEKIILFVGTITQRKGVDLLYEIFKLLLEKIQNLHLIIIGNVQEQKLKDEILMDANLSGIIQQIDFIEPIYSIEQYFQIADIFLFPSRREGFGSVLIQAMSCELPVVALNIQGITNEIINNEYDGFTINHEEPMLFRDVCLRILNNYELNKKVVQNAREKILSCYRQDYIDAKYYKLYLNLLKSI